MQIVTESSVQNRSLHTRNHFPQNLIVLISIEASHVTCNPYLDWARAWEKVVAGRVLLWKSSDVLAVSLPSLAFRQRTSIRWYTEELCKRRIHDVVNSHRSRKIRSQERRPILMVEAFDFAGHYNTVSLISSIWNRKELGTREARFRSCFHSRFCYW